jgi:hypothetical protein
LEESSDKQNFLSTNLTRRWESKCLLSGIEGVGEDTTLMTKPVTQVKAVARMDTEVTDTEQGMVVMLNNEILIETIDMGYDGRGVHPRGIKRNFK